jgi:hypothetical protein
MMHYQLNDQEHAAVSEAKRRGASFDRPEMLCRTGDAHADGTRNWALVTCPQCQHIGKTWRPYRGE